MVQQDNVQQGVSSHHQGNKKTKSRNEELGDFSTTLRVLPISALAVGIGAMCAFVALALLRLIGLFTNLFYYGHWGSALVSPAGNHLGWFSILVPIGGAFVIGIMARYGSERIRGHGIPEAIEAILINGSRVEPKVAFLKPLSSAISIGSGGPFGAEGPIIMTGGAFGSMIAQLFHLTSAERKTLLVAGVAGGMSATFASPVAAVLLAVELLLFEWKPRSLVPVALGRAVAAVVRLYSGFWAAFSCARASFAYWAACLGRLRARWFARWCSFRAADGFRVRCGRRISEIADSLDVVADDRRAGDWFGRHGFSAGSA